MSVARRNRKRITTTTITKSNCIQQRIQQTNQIITNNNLLFQACKEGNLSRVQTLIQDNTTTCTFTTTDINRRSALHFAAREGRLSIVQYLHQNNANILHQDKYGRTPLYVAAERNHLHIVQYLYHNGAATTISIPCNQGKTPILTAATSGNVDIIKYLTEQGANITTSDHYDRTPMYIAIEKNNLNLIKYIHSIHPKELIRRNIQTGDTPFFSAGFNHQWKILKWRFSVVTAPAIEVPLLLREVDIQSRTYLYQMALRERNIEHRNYLLFVQQVMLRPNCKVGCLHLRHLLMFIGDYVRGTVEYRTSWWYVLDIMKEVVDVDGVVEGSGESDRRMGQGGNSSNGVKGCCVVS